MVAEGGEAMDRSQVPNSSERAGAERRLPVGTIRLGAGLEASDFRRPFGRQDIGALYGFNDRFREDLALLKKHGFRLLRVGTRWYHANPAPGVFDWSYLDPLWEEIVRL